MGNPREDIAGKRFGKLVAKSIAPSVNKETKWYCQCDCGNTLSVFTKALKYGRSKSCGCTKERHGLSKSAEYATYRKMKERCRNPNNPDWHLYGGKGVELRFQSFAEFLAAVGPRPGGHSIDRIDSSGHYETGNVRWATPEAQANNISTNRLIEFQGCRMTLSQWGRKTGLGRQVIEKRIDDLGWTTEDALTRPVK